MYITKNYEDMGGDRFVVGGELKVVAGGKITIDGVQAEAIVNPTDLATALVAIASLTALLKSLGATK
ncbi:MAG TPA: hypothetical protein VIM42_04275 [Clostridium sp.]